MNAQNITFSANEQILTKTDDLLDFASNTVSYIEATFTLGTNWTGFDSVRAVWKSDYHTIATVLDANHKCVVPSEILMYRSKVYVNLVGSIAENNVLTDRLTTFPVQALVVTQNAEVDGTETAPVTASQFEQFVETVQDAADSISDYSYDSEAWAVGTRGGVDVPSTDPTYHNNSKYWAEENAGLADDVAGLADDVADLKSDLNYSLFDGNNVFNTKIKSYSNNTAVTNNNDGTYTIGTSDYGNTTFGGSVHLKAGVYKLYGVPQGKSHVGTSYKPSDAIVVNESSAPKVFVLTADADLFLAYTITAKPSTSFTITPFLYRTKIEDILDKRKVTVVINLTGFNTDGESAGCRKKGDIYYNPDTKLLRMADNDALSSYSTVSFNNTALYYNMQEDSYYVYGSSASPLNPIDSVLATTVAKTEIENCINKNVREHLENVSAVGGKLITNSTSHNEVGYMQQHIINDNDFNNWLSTPNFIKYDNNIFSIDTTDFDSITIFCYDNTFVCRAQVTAIADIPFYTSYIKVMAFKATGFSRLMPIKVMCKGELRFAKNTAPTLGTARYFSYEVSVGHYTNAEETSDAYSGDQTRYYDDAYVILPPNYSPNGEPVQMVMYTHGSLGYAFGQTEPSYYDLQQMVAKDGFLVCDCRALTSKYIADDLAENTGNTGNLDDGITPLSVACYCQFYNYMIANYNIRTDGCYMYGKSSGGLMPALMSALRPFAIRAAAGLAPMISLFSDLDYIANEPAMVYWQLQQFGYDMTGMSPEYPGPTRQQVLGQSELLLGYDPLLINSDLDEKTIDTHIANNSGTITDAGIETLSENKHKCQNVPIKIWVAEDDPYCRSGIIKFYKRIIDNANGICKVRYFSVGTGQHHAVDTSTSAPKVDYNTRYGGVINMPVAYAEMLDWFKQW